MAILYAAGHFYAKYKLRDFIENDLVSGKVQVEDIGLNLLTGDISAAQLKTVDSTGGAIGFQIEEFHVKGVDYYKLLTTDTLQADKFLLSNYKIQLGEKNTSQQDSTKSKIVIAIKNIDLTDGQIIKTKSNQQTAYVDMPQAIFKNTSLPIADPISGLQYVIEEVKIDSVFYKMNQRENVYLAGMVMNQDSITGRNLRLITNDSVQALVNTGKINYDILDLKAPTIKLADYNLKLSQPQRLTIKEVSIQQPVFESTCQRKFHPSRPLSHLSSIIAGHETGTGHSHNYREQRRCLPIASHMIKPEKGVWLNLTRSTEK